jgi:hypothetical protein
MRVVSFSATLLGSLGVKWDYKIELYLSQKKSKKERKVEELKSLGGQLDPRYSSQFQHFQSKG